MLSLRVSRDKRGYDYIYLLLEARRRGRVENRLLYCGRWPAPCRVGPRPFDDETRTRLEQAHPDVPFDWPTLLKTLQAAIGVSRPPMAGPPPPSPSASSSRSRRPGAPSGRPGAPFRSPAPPPMSRRGDREAPRGLERERDHEPLSTEVVLVSAELEDERDAAYAEPDTESEQEREHERAHGHGHEPPPEFEPVCEADRPFAATINLELMTDEVVHIHVPEPAQPPEAIPVEGHVFTEASGPATFDAPAIVADGDGEDDAAEGDGEGDDTGADSGPDAAAGAGPAAATAAGPDEQARRRRRRRRGGRGRGKPPDIRQSSE